VKVKINADGHFNGHASLLSGARSLGCGRCGMLCAGFGGRAGGRDGQTTRLLQWDWNDDAAKAFYGRCISNKEIGMPKDAHNKAAEHHDSAAKSHRMAAEHHGKGHHEKGREESAKAQMHSKTAREHSDIAHSKSLAQK
jgi:hypothetical protein